MLLLNMIAAIAGADCSPPAGTDVFLRSGARLLAVGERHGTAESPAAFGEIVCAAVSQSPVTVILEFPDAMQPAIDAAMTSPSAETAREQLLIYPQGPFRFHDGRGSEAMMALFLRLRDLKAAGLSLDVVAGVPDSPRVEGFTQSHAELDRAALWSRTARARPDSRIMIFVGGAHAEKVRRTRGGLGLPALAHFRPEETLSVYVAQQGGTAWNCVDDCGVREEPDVDAKDLSGLVFRPEDDGTFDGVLALGPTTASPPVSRR